jgi:GTP-binding protein LepA
MVSVYQLNFHRYAGARRFFLRGVPVPRRPAKGALLVVDAGQGVEAQSVANCYTAIEQGLEVLPILNKMDLPQADPDRVRQEIEEIIGIDASGSLPGQRQVRPRA